MSDPRPPDGSDRSIVRKAKDVTVLRARLGAQLQKQRLLRGLSQAELAEYADLSLKYIGEIERGEANTTLEVLERLAAAVGWDPLDVLHGLREPITEGVRQLLVTIVQQVQGRCGEMQTWLAALDPDLDVKVRPPLPKVDPREHRRSRRNGPRMNTPPSDR